MPEKPSWQDIERDRDMPVKLPVDPEQALRGLLAVDPESDEADAEGKSSDEGEQGRGSEHG
jgi:hypothetical protein